MMTTFTFWFWVFPSILTTILAVTMEIIDRKSATNIPSSKFTGKDIMEILFLMYTPIIQYIPIFYIAHDALKTYNAKHKAEKTEFQSLHENMNELFECTECGLVQRMHQLTAEQYQHCCGDDYRDTMRKVSNPRIREFALASGLTPLMSKQEVKQQLKEKKSEKKKKEIEKTNNQKMNLLLEKTEYVQKQNAIYLKKEYAKLEAMNEEKERRKEMAIQMLDGIEKEEFLQTIALFDELYAVEIEKLAVLEKNNKVTLASLKGKLPA